MASMVRSGVWHVHAYFVNTFVRHCGWRGGSGRWTSRDIRCACARVVAALYSSSSSAVDRWY